MLSMYVDVCVGFMRYCGDCDIKTLLCHTTIGQDFPSLLVSEARNWF